MSVFTTLQGGPGGRTVGQGGMHAAGGPGTNGDNAVNVRWELFCFSFAFVAGSFIIINLSFYSDQ